MKVLLVIMTGIGFTLGVVLGLLLHLPTDSLPARQHQAHPASGSGSGLDNARFKRQAAGNHKIETGKDDPASLRIFGDISGVDGRAPSLHLSHWNALQERNSNELSVNANLNNVNINNEEKRTSDERSFVNQNTGERKGSGSGVRNSNPNSTVGKTGRSKTPGSSSLEDELYLSSIVNGVYWTDRVESVCGRPFVAAETNSWRAEVQDLDVVKMETGCGRMQNRLLTLRDASKACARYRLNTDQIQGDIFSYYLSKLLHIPNLAPTVLASVNSVDKKWRTVHLDLSLAQWADSKIVVLTKFIEGLQPAHIPKEFRDERRQLHPTLAHLGTKSQPQTCELLQWSDLIVFDYLTANLDRVINNMYNSQWNDQMMSNPTHNLEQFAKGGGLVFLDNESGLFHGYRLIEKYEKLHRALLDSVCVFRSSTADVIKRLATSGTVGKELRALLESNEPLAKHVPTIPAKNVKILEKRIQQVYKQIVRCEQEFSR